MKKVLNAVYTRPRSPTPLRGTFFTTITTQNTLIQWMSDFWTYTTRHVGRVRHMNVTPGSDIST